MNGINNNRIKQIGFLILLVGLSILIFTQLSSFLPAFLGAVTLYVLMRKAMHKMVHERKLSKGLSASILLIISFLIVLVPTWILITLLSTKINAAVQNSDQVLAAIKHFANQIEQKYNIELLSNDNMGKARTMVATSLPNILGATFNTLTSLAIMYFMLYFMLTQSREIELWLFRHLPLKTENKVWLGNDFQKLVFNNAIGMPLIALAQGIVALIGYLIFGVPDPLFWFVVTSFAAMLPFVGAALAYVPLGILLLSQGPAWKGIVILIYGFAIIGLTDNIFRITLQKRLGDVHPLITLFGVILGVNLFGFIGLIFGPILISVFLLLIYIYVNEFSSE
jgi:predicted PurR-regulated permease PerM